MLCGAVNFKSPGRDKLQYFWVKNFKNCHNVLAQQFSYALENRSPRTNVYCGQDSSSAKIKYFIWTFPMPHIPISTMYKLLISIFKRIFEADLERNNILFPSQNGCSARNRGTKELLLIDLVASHVVYYSAAWIDYKKVFDSVLHTWLHRILELYKINEVIPEKLTFFLCVRSFPSVGQFSWFGRFGPFLTCIGLGSKCRM